MTHRRDNRRGRATVDYRHGRGISHTFTPDSRPKRTNRANTDQ